MMRFTQAALKIRETMDKAGAMLTDEQASTVADLYPHMRFNGELIKAGTRINWDGCIMRAAVDLWDREDSTPAIAPSLWSEINYRDGARVIPDVITAELAFSEGELGWWKNVIYRSKINANVWTPEMYPQGWEAL